MTQPIVMKNTDGYSVAKCPGCGENPAPGEQRLTMPGDWRVWHTSCHAGICPFCAEKHEPPFDGMCLI